MKRSKVHRMFTNGIADTIKVQNVILRYSEAD